MSRYLITCTPAHGHVVPLLQIARHLLSRGHDVSFLTSSRYAERVQAAGARFLPLPVDADVDLDDADGAFPERRGLTGPAALRFDMSNLFVRPGAAQLAAIRAELEARPVDAVLTEPLFVGGALLQLLPAHERPPVVVLGIFPLGARSADTAPFGLGVTPLPGPLGRLRNAALRTVAERAIFGGVQKEADAMARREVGRDLGGFVLDWAGRADAYVQFTVPEFEYPRPDLPATVHFAGPLPPTPSDPVLPEWWSDLDGSRPIVHVTQGTIANSDFGQLVQPTIAALAASDALVVVSTGGRPVDALAGKLPDNVRVAEYLPYDRLLPLVDVLVTNGGYGGVQQALAHGVPLVVAGQTEDKVEVCARVGWSGAGVNLRTSTATPAQVARAVERVRSDSSYRANAERIGAAMRDADAWRELDRSLDELAGRWARVRGGARS
ncbi:glycosyltransferase family 1 protein [Microbacterium sp. ISL-59]|uniref:glycosyltransferase n=1 Tax=Microbacterium sp. ISL-59 TaxID=2819159 RepID=UPI001BE6C14D|nr:glycosyltransferase [Microbacterium sp. ISL-59]MBT2496041.1 glycosyltransferase family 1 protein [Microbacterium sp. ISL-59]